MNEMLVLRRADGELFTEEINGKQVIPLWSSSEEVARYKERNPKLITFLPTQLTGALRNKSKSIGGTGTEFFLISEENHDANLDDGNPVSLEEIFSRGKYLPREVRR